MDACQQKAMTSFSKYIYHPLPAIMGDNRSEQLKTETKTKTKPKKRKKNLSKQIG